MIQRRSHHCSQQQQQQRTRRPPVTSALNRSTICSRHFSTCRGLTLSLKVAGSRRLRSCPYSPMLSQLRGVRTTTVTIHQTAHRLHTSSAISLVWTNRDQRPSNSVWILLRRALFTVRRHSSAAAPLAQTTTAILVLAVTWTRR